MRTTFPKLVEEGRIREGQFASDPGWLGGAFRLRHPSSGQIFQVIASSAAIWEKDGMRGQPWDHVSVTCTSQKRCPTWKEMCWVKSLFWDDEECVIEFHPPTSRYVNVHERVLHLWKPVGVELPMPPLATV